MTTLPGRRMMLKGIAAGDLVVIEGTQRIGPGSAVAVVEGSPKPAAAVADKKG